MNKKEKNLEKIFRLCLKIFYYYYFILSIINLICFNFKLYTILNITTILILVGIIIEFANGFVRGFFGILGYIISVLLAIYFIKDIWLGISIGISILNILNVILSKLFGRLLMFMMKKFN